VTTERGKGKRKKGIPPRKAAKTSMKGLKSSLSRTHMSSLKPRRKVMMRK